MATFEKDFVVKKGIRVTNAAYFLDEKDNPTNIIDWTLGNRQKITLVSSIVSPQFINPLGPSNLILKIVQDSGGHRQIDWGTLIDWGDMGVPTLSYLPLKYDLLTLYFDGAIYHGMLATGYGPH